MNSWSAMEAEYMNVMAGLGLLARAGAQLEGQLGAMLVEFGGLSTTEVLPMLWRQRHRRVVPIIEARTDNEEKSRMKAAHARSIDLMRRRNSYIHAQWAMGDRGVVMVSADGTRSKFEARIVDRRELDELSVAIDQTMGQLAHKTGVNPISGIPIVPVDDDSE